MRSAALLTAMTFGLGLIDRSTHTTAQLPKGPRNKPGNSLTAARVKAKARRKAQQKARRK